MSIEIRRVDPGDEDAIREFYDIYVRVGRHNGLGFIPSPYAELASLIRTPTEDFAYTGFLAYDGGEPVGEGWYAEFLRFNRNKVTATPRVPPEHRRRGAGSALLRHMEEHARARGRTLAGAETFWPVAHGPEGTGAPSAEFARKHGYRLVLVEAVRKLPLPVADVLLDELVGKADPAYEIRRFDGPVPDELVQGWAELEASLPTEAPTGELEIEVNPPSVEAIRGEERMLAESGQARYSAAALAPDGTVAGYSSIVVRSADDPAKQWGTLVRRDHRGHGLGYGVKAAVVDLLQRERPGITAAITSNALTNTPMVAVNDRLGYEVIEYVGRVQKHL